MAATDELLISRAVVEHDVQAFDELVKRHQSRVRGWLRHLTGNLALADDLAQETFFKAWRKLGSFRAKGSFESWLLSIARNEFLQHQRKAGREAGHMERLRSASYTEAAPMRSTAAGFEGEAQDVERFLTVLGPDERDIMILVYGVGLSHSEASEVSGLPLGTVKSHVRRSVTKLRQQFGLQDDSSA